MHVGIVMPKEEFVHWWIVTCMHGPDQEYPNLEW